jgi:hypothetical protein
MLLSWDLRVTVDGRKDVSFPGNNWYVERIEKQILESVVKGVRTAEKMAVFQATIGT